MLLGCDVESLGLDTFHGCLPYLVTTYNSIGEQRTWQWEINPKNREVLVIDSEVEEIQELLDSSDKLIFHNAKFDIKMLSVIGIKVDHLWSKVEDTLFIAHMLASQTDHDLTSVVKAYLKHDITPFELKMQTCVQAARRWCKSHLKDWKLANEGIEDEDGEQLMPSTKGSNDKSGRAWMADTWLPRTVALHEGPGWVKGHQNEDWLTVTEDYADIDSSCLIPLFKELMKEVERRSLTKIYRERLKILPVVHRMEHYGTTYKLDTHIKMKKEFTEKVEELEAVLYGIAEIYNYPLELPKRSRNKSLDTFIFDVLKLPVLEWSTPTKGRVYPSDKPFTPKPVFDKNVKEEYELALLDHSLEQRFIKILNEKSEYDTALGYMNAYERFCIKDKEDIRYFSQKYSTLHPNLNPTGTVGLRFSHNNPNCCDGDTEILTRGGWIKFKDLSEGLEVAQFNSKNDEITFIEPTRVVNQHYKGKMCHIKTDEYIEMLVTPNHRCLLETRKGKKIDLPADSFKPDYKHLHAGWYLGGSVTYTRDEIIWLCAVQADGSYQITNGDTYGVRLTFKKKRKIDRFEECLKGMGTRYTKKIKGDLTYFYIGKNEPATQLVMSVMPDKQFGSWLLDLCRENLDQITQEVFEWDGSNRSRPGGYSSSIKENSDWIQVVMCLSQNRSMLRSYTPNTAWSVSDHHYLNVVPGRNYSMTTNHTYETVDWDDKVYCVTVPTGYIVIRKNGRVSITGNSSNVSKHKKTNLRRCFGPREGRVWYSLDYTGIELAIPAYEAGETEMIRVFDSPDDPPYYGSYHLLIFDTLHPEKFKEYGKAVKQVYEDTWYQWCKNGSFARQYGAQEKKVDQTYRVPGAFKAISKRFPKVDALSQKMLRIAERNDCVITIPDRFIDPDRGFPIQSKRNKWMKVEPTTPLCYHVSSTAAQVLNRAMVMCDKHLCNWRLQRFDVHMILCIHDELVFDFPAEYDDNYKFTDEKANELRTIMESASNGINIPIKVSVERHTDSWAIGETVLRMKP